MSIESAEHLTYVKTKMVESAISLERAMAGLRKSAEESAKAFAGFDRAARNLDIDFADLPGFLKQQAE